MRVKRLKATHRRRYLFWLECRNKDKKLTMIQKTHH